MPLRDKCHPGMKVGTVINTVVACAFVAFALVAIHTVLVTRSPRSVSDAPIKAYKRFARYANWNVAGNEVFPISDPLSPLADLPAIDRCLARPGLAGVPSSADCREVLDGPRIYRVKHPQKRGRRTVIGFTGEYRVRYGLWLSKARAIVYWQMDGNKNEHLNFQSYRSAEFDRLMQFHGIDPAQAEPFDFPGLRAALGSGVFKELSGRGSPPHDIIRAALKDARRNTADDGTGKTPPEER